MEVLHIKEKLTKVQEKFKEENQKISEEERQEGFGTGELKQLKVVCMNLDLRGKQKVSLVALKL